MLEIPQFVEKSKLISDQRKIKKMQQIQEKQNYVEIYSINQSNNVKSDFQSNLEESLKKIDDCETRWKEINGNKIKNHG
jgi:hypothetical protein